MTSALSRKQAMSARWHMLSVALLRAAHQAGWPALVGGMLLGGHRRVSP